MTLGEQCATLAALGLGLGALAGLTPAVSAKIPGVIATFGATRAAARPYRLALALAFMLGVAALLGPTGALAALLGQLIGPVWWSTPLASAVTLVGALGALSMFGFFGLALLGRLGAKLAAVGTAGLRGAFAMGVVAVFLAAESTLPFAIGIGTLTMTTGNGWHGLILFGAFAVGLASPFVIAAAFAATEPRSRTWTMGARWLSGLVLAVMALVHLRRTSNVLDSLVRNPRYEPGIAAGLAFLVGVALAAVHVLAERKGACTRARSKWARLASIVPAVVGGSLLLGWLPNEHGNAPPVAWVLDEQHGRVMAAAAHKPALLVFNATWCCGEVEHVMFSDPRVREEAQRFVPIAIDASDDDEPDVRRLLGKYAVLGMPTVIMLDADGREVVRIQSIASPAELARQMHDVGR